METTKNKFADYISYFFILLFCYAGLSKVMDFENFQVQLAQSPLLSAYAGIISYGVIVTEALICILLAIPKTRIFGIASSFAIMWAFTVYIILVLKFSDFIPCSCGGILEKMGWTEHLIFNFICVLAAGFATFLSLKRSGGWKKPLRYITYLTIIPVVGMIGLFLSSEYIMKKENNFTRRFPHHPITEDKSYDLKVNSFYFVGTDSGNVYLGNPSSPFRIYKLDAQFKKMDTINLNPETGVIFKNLRYILQSKTVFAYDGSVPVIYTVDLDSISKPLKVASRNDIYFDELVPVNKSQYYVRIEDFASKRLGLAYLSPKENQKIKISNSILTKKVDGGFDADGKLLFDQEQGEAYYLFFYRNQILKINQDLKVTKQMKTIDPFTEANLDIIKLKDGRTKMNKPSQLVNRNMIVHRGLVFNEANLMGRHEPKDLWKKNAVVDVYNTSTAEYWGSFYVPHRGPNKMFQMMMTDDYFYILSGNEIVRYRCAQTLTGNFVQGRSRKPFKE